MENGIMRLSQVSLLTGLKRHTINARAKNTFDNQELTRSPSNQILLTPSQVKRLIEDRLHSEKGRVIYVGNLKGGVGKTALSYLIVNTLTTIGLKVCAIDLDVQANLTNQFMNIDVNQPVFFDVIDNQRKIEDVIIELSPCLHFIPSSLKNSLIQKSLSMQAPKHHLTWFNSICLDYLRENYDVIVVDTPPHLTTLNSVFCLCLKEHDQIAVPACAEEFSILGVQMFLEDILLIRDSYKVTSNPKISIIMNRFFQNQKNNLEMLVEMGKKHGDMLSDLIIRESAQIKEIINNKIPIGEIKNGKDIYETISDLLYELRVLKRNDK